MNKKRILLICVIAGLATLSGVLLTTWHQVLGFPLIDDPAMFAATFDPAGQQATTLGTGNALSLIGDVVPYFRSPLFPYVPLSLTADFAEERCPIAYTSLYEDAFWNVAWVRVGWCTSTGRQSELFGPYRVPKVRP